MHYSGNVNDFGMDTISLAGTLEAKLKAVREAGFSQIMLSARDLVGHPDGLDAAIAAVKTSGLRVTGFQVLRDFEGLSGHLHDYKIDIAKSMLEMCHALDCRVLLICSSTSVHATGDTAALVKSCGASMLRGGAYKPRTSPYSFQGLGVEGLELLAEAREQSGLPIVTELMDARDIEPVLEVADLIQVGARNMQNYGLLTELGRAGRPVMLKRGLSATLEEFVMAAEYILKEGNEQVILCERGIRTFETAYRFTLDLMAVPVLKEMTHLPIVIDPSHAAGRRVLVQPLSLAAAAVGADGIIVEVHPEPEEAICDGPQALRSEEFEQYAQAVDQAAQLAGKASFLQTQARSA